MKNPVRLAMVGGGEGAFIGAVHRFAARLDGRYALVAGVFSSDPAKSARSGEALGIAPDRLYADFATMARAEAARPDGAEVVSIVTPNHVHAPAAKAVLEAGLHVICDKPLTNDLASARELMRVAAARPKQIFALTYHYTAYAMLRQARAMVAAGELGRVRVIQVEYAQDWLSSPIERDGNKQASWRTDPSQAGAGALGDIGSHAFNLAGFVSGMAPSQILAELTSQVEGRRIDDNVSVLMRYPTGASGMLWASQVAPGQGNDLTLRIFGDQAGLEWRHEQPDTLKFTRLGSPTQLIHRGAAGSWPEAAAVSRIPGGHPEGYLEAFATVYTEVAQAIRDPDAPRGLFQTIEDGVHDMEFIDAAQRSSAAGGVWTHLG